MQHQAVRAMMVGDWAEAFFRKLSRILERTVSYAPDGFGSVDSRDPDLRIVGSDDCFMSIWSSDGIVWDSDGSRESAVEAAADHQSIER
jgi:hypothetical protein